MSQSINQSMTRGIKIYTHKSIHRSIMKYVNQIKCSNKPINRWLELKMLKSWEEFIIPYHVIRRVSVVRPPSVPLCSPVRFRGALFPQSTIGNERSTSEWVTGSMGSSHWRLRDTQRTNRISGCPTIHTRDNDEEERARRKNTHCMDINYRFNPLGVVGEWGSQVPAMENEEKSERRGEGRKWRIDRQRRVNSYTIKVLINHRAYKSNNQSETSSSVFYLEEFKKNHSSVLSFQNYDERKYFFRKSAHGQNSRNRKRCTTDKL